jgi:nucleoside-triphosphatase THEP1
MAILFGRIRSISRGSGNSAVMAAAYRSCCELILNVSDNNTGCNTEIIYDYRSKKGLVFSEIFAPDIFDEAGKILNPPEWVTDRQTLWQYIENIEGRVNSELAKEYVIALPKEFDHTTNIALLKEFIDTSFLVRGIVVDVNYHADNIGNPHAHIMFPMRRLGINSRGEIDFTEKAREWKSYEFLRCLKQEQQVIINKYYAKHNSAYELNWGTVDGLKATFHHNSIKRLKQENSEIIKQNARTIIANPSLVIDKISHNKAIFSFEDIINAIDKTLFEAELFTSTSDIGSTGKKKNKYLKDIKLRSVRLNSIKEKILKAVLASSNLIALPNTHFEDKRLFAKTTQVNLEKRFITHITSLNSRKDHVIDITDKDISVFTSECGAKYKFTNQQREVIKQVLSGSNISIIQGWAGAGKTTVSGEIIRHFLEKGYEVIGVAPTHKAAKELSDKIGIKTYTMAALRRKWEIEQGRGTEYYKEQGYNDNFLKYSHNNSSNNASNNSSLIARMHPQSVLIIDEISMIDLPNFDYFTSEVVKAGSKMICLGDNNQNQAIGIKGAAVKATEIVGTSMLTENNRHQNPDKSIKDLHIKATEALSKYQIEQALSIYEELAAINIAPNETLKIQSIISAYISKLIEIRDRGAGTVDRENIVDKIEIKDAVQTLIIIAHTNDEINILNEQVRNSLKRCGILSGRSSYFISCTSDNTANNSQKMVELYEGDQIIFKTNQPARNGFAGIMNNEFAVVHKIVSSCLSGKGQFIAKISRAGREVMVMVETGNADRPIAFKHAYAVTNYAIQGASIDHVLLSLDRYSGYETSLVGLTRHKQTCQIFAAQTTLEEEIYRIRDYKESKTGIKYNVISYEISHEFIGNYKKSIPLWKIGLHSLISKRANLNFAVDYINVANKLNYKGDINYEDNIKLDFLRDNLADNYSAVKDYLSARQVLHNRKNKKQDREFVRNDENAKNRQRIASENIIDNYTQEAEGKLRAGELGMPKLLSQFGLKPHIIKKHAGVGKYHYYLQPIETKSKTDGFSENIYYKKLLSAIKHIKKEPINNKRIKTFSYCYHQLNQNVSSLQKQVTELKAERDKLLSQYHGKILDLKQSELFREKEFGIYIEQIYKTDRAKVIETLNQLISKTKDKQQLISLLQNSPEIIGELKVQVPLHVTSQIKPQKLKSRIFNLNEYSELQQRLKIYADNLQHYIESGNILSKHPLNGIGSDLIQNDYEKNVTSIEKRITTLEALLPNKKDLQAIKKAAIIIKKAISNNTSRKLITKQVILKNGKIKAQNFVKEDERIALKLYHKTGSTNKIGRKLDTKIKNAISFLIKHANWTKENIAKLSGSQGKQQSKQNVDLKKLHKVLVKECQNHNLSFIKSKLHIISEGKKVIFEGQKFSLQKDYLEYLYNNSKQAYLPRRQIKLALDIFDHRHNISQVTELTPVHHTKNIKL